MSLLLGLPVLDGAKVIIVDEGFDAKYAESLITAWLSVWKAKDSRSIDLLCFSGPKHSNKIYLNSLNLLQQKIIVHDFYTLALDKADPFDDQKLWESPEIVSLKQDSTVIIDSLSCLILYKGLAESCRFIEKLSAKVAQIVCIYQGDFGQTKVPSINTLGTSYVRIKPTLCVKLNHNLSYKTRTVHCKPGGGILQQVEIVEQNINSYEIKAEKDKVTDRKNAVARASEPAKKIQASFRIEINDREMEQREATPLPYTVATLQPNESKIHYVPDKVDDLDEEDPDDDLDF